MYLWSVTLTCSQDAGRKDGVGEEDVKEERSGSPSTQLQEDGAIVVYIIIADIYIGSGPEGGHMKWSHGFTLDAI